MKKISIYILLIVFCSSFLTSCGNFKSNEIGNYDELSIYEEETNQDTSEFDRVFENFTSLTENIRDEKEIQKDTQQNIDINEENLNIVDVEDYTDENLNLIVNFIDVGQGDSILIKSNNEYMLIDAGDTFSKDKVYEYVSSKTSTLKYFVTTHPHKDHIGGASEILTNIEVSNVVMPNISYDKSSYYKKMIDIINEREINIVEPIVGDEYILGDATIMVLAPNNNEYDDLNNYSIVLKVTYGEVSFLLCGDAENLSENEIMETGFDISANVLKLGHHGSKYSSSSKFLDMVSPSVAVISVGENNQYGHPYEDTLNKLNSRNILTYRTDINGTISIGIDGINLYAITEKVNSDINFDTDKNIIENDISIEESFIYPEDEDTYIVYTTRDEKYHNEDCSSLGKVHNTTTLGVAKEMNLTPCEECNPPK